MKTDDLALNALAGAAVALREAAAELAVATALASTSSLATDASVLAHAVEAELAAVWEVGVRHS